MILEVLFGISLIILSLSVYGNYNQDRKLQLYETWVSEFANDVQQIKISLEKIDSSGVFRADDQVGYTFEQINYVVKKLYDYEIISQEEPTGDFNAEET